MYCGICQREVDRLEKGNGRPMFKACASCRRALEREGAVYLCDLRPCGYAYPIVSQGFKSPIVVETSFVETSFVLFESMNKSRSRTKIPARFIVRPPWCGLRGQVKRAAEIRAVAAEVAAEAEASAVFVVAVFPASAAPVVVSVAAVFVVAPVFARAPGSAAGVAAPFAAAWPDLPVAEPLSRVVAPAVAEAFGAPVPA